VVVGDHQFAKDVVNFIHGARQRRRVHVPPNVLVQKVHRLADETRGDVRSSSNEPVQLSVRGHIVLLKKDSGAGG